MGTKDFVCCEPLRVKGQGIEWLEAGCCKQKTGTGDGVRGNVECVVILSRTIVS